MINLFIRSAKISTSNISGHNIILKQYYDY